MRGKRVQFFNYLVVLSALLLFTSACGNQAKTSGNDFSNSPRSQSGTNPDLDNDENNSSTTERECFNPINDLNETALALFFGPDNNGNFLDVQNLEGPATACVFETDGKFHLRVEYEDDYHVRAYSSAATVAKTEFLLTRTTPSNTEIIFMDNVGFIQLAGSESAGWVELEIKFANLPSYYQKDSGGNYITDSNGRLLPTEFSATYNEQVACLNSSNGDAKTADGDNCSTSKRFPRSFWKSSWWGTTFTANQLSNILTMARQYTNNTFASDFASSSLNIKNGTIGKIQIRPLE